MVNQSKEEICFFGHFLHSIGKKDLKIELLNCLHAGSMCDLWDFRIENKNGTSLVIDYDGGTSCDGKIAEGGNGNKEISWVSEMWEELEHFQTQKSGCGVVF